jgi:fructose-1,6-bisphosphatase I
MGQFPLTLGRFIALEQADHPGATGEFSALLSQIGLVGKLLAQDLRRAGLTNILGTTGETNVQGETIKKLDEIANQTFLKVFDQSGLVCALASEEMEKPVLFPENWPEAKYCYSSIGWLIEHGLQYAARRDLFRRDVCIQERMPFEDDLICKGTEQVAASYLLFGSNYYAGLYGWTGSPWLYAGSDIGGISCLMSRSIFRALQGLA